MKFSVQLPTFAPCPTSRSAHIDPSRYQQLVIAEQFTEIDGSTRIYIAQESITPGLSAWPVPHDAPYQQVFNKWIQAVLEVIIIKYGCNKIF